MPNYSVMIDCAAKPHFGEHQDLNDSFDKLLFVGVLSTVVPHPVQYWDGYVACKRHDPTQATTGAGLLLRYGRGPNAYWWFGRKAAMDAAISRNDMLGCAIERLYEVADRNDLLNSGVFMTLIKEPNPMVDVMLDVPLPVFAIQLSTMHQNRFAVEVKSKSDPRRIVTVWVAPDECVFHDAEDLFKLTQTPVGHPGRQIDLEGPCATHR